jgi:hypothetical protein
MDINPEERVQNLADTLSNLQIHHQSEAQRSEALLADLSALRMDVNSIRLTLQDVTQRLLLFHQQIVTLQSAPPPNNHPSFIDVGIMPHASFSGNPKEINQFLYFVKDRLIEVEPRFQTEKSKINWVVRHFRNSNGNISEPTPSYNWWMSLLKENARTQELPTQFASAEDPYILPCLHSIRSFLAKLEEVFADRNSVEDAKRALYSCKQGNMSLDVFNSLVYAVDLTEESRCDLYKRALNPRILEIAIVKDSWKSADTLRKKQDLAVLASNILDELNQLRGNMSVRQPNHCPSAPPPPAAPTPMDIDAITASTGFTFPLYRALCVKNKLCQRCHKAYDKAHINNRSCPNVEVSMKDKVDLFTRLSREQPNTQVSNINVSAVDFDFNPAVQSWDHLGHHSISDLLMFGCNSEGNPLNDGKPPLFISSINPSIPTLSPPVVPSRLVISIRLLRPSLPPITASALIDSGAGDSFIDANFVRNNQLHLTLLPSPLSCRSFDGSLATSGDVTHCWRGSLIGCDSRDSFQTSVVSLNVISLASVDIILGLPWLKNNNAWVGGPQGQLLFSSSLFCNGVSSQLQSSSAEPSSANNSSLLNQDEILSLPSALRSYSDVFTVASLQSLPPVRPQFDFRIQLKEGSTPPFGGLYNLSEGERRQLREYVDENLAKGFIRLSSSPAAAPIFFVKTDGKADRPCVDYRGLNAMTIRDSYPIPVLSLLLNNLAGCKYLSKIDLKSAFNLLRVTPGQEYLTAFRTPWGLYEYTVMPFGLANAPATFQRFIQHVLQQFIDVCCFVYIDDILIFSKTESDHLLHLTQILSQLRKFSLKASLNKCQFFQSEVNFLGFIITSTGLRMDPKKLDTILQWPIPETLRGLRRFLGFCNFYRRFIPRFSAIAGELTALTKESMFQPDSLHQKGPHSSFMALRSAFSSAPLLSHFSFAAERVVHVDSSGFAIAGVLSQPDGSGKLRPVSFFSRKLSDQERAWPIFDLEMLAVVSAFEEWRAWLAGTPTPVLIFSDHAAKTLTPKQARWAAYLDSFNFKLLHLSGVSNPADGPSRRPDFDNSDPLILPNSLSSKIHISAISPDSHSKPDHDLYFQPASLGFITSLKESYSSMTTEEKEDYFFYSDCYWFRHRLCVPIQLRERVIKTLHDGPLVGHPGIARTLSLILRTFDWPSIRKDVINFVNSCDSCQRVRFSRQSPAGLLQPLPVPSRPWSVIGMDMVTKLPLSNHGCY